MIKKDSRGKFWKKISKADRKKRMTEIVQKRWAKTTPEQRSEHGKKLSELRWKKTA